MWDIDPEGGVVETRETNKAKAGRAALVKTLPSLPYAAS